MTHFPASGQRLTMLKMGEKIFNCLIVLTLLLSSFAPAAHPVTAAPNPGAASAGHSAPQTDPLPPSRPLIERPEPRMGVRPTDPAPAALPKEQSPALAAQAVSQSRAPLMVIENVGQFDPKVKFQIKGGQDTVNFVQNEFWLTSIAPKNSETSQERIPLALPTPVPGGSKSKDKGNAADTGAVQGTNLRFELVGAAAQPKVEGINRLDTVVSFFQGNDPKKWRKDVPVWGGLRYVDIYPGVDLEVKGDTGEWNWQLVVKDEKRFAASAQIRKSGIVLRVHGAQGLNLDQDKLVMRAEAGNKALPALTLSRPNQAKAQKSLAAPAAPKLVDQDWIILAPESVEAPEPSSTPAAVSPTTRPGRPTATPAAPLTSTPTPVPQASVTPAAVTRTPSASTNTPAPVVTHTPRLSTPLAATQTPSGAVGTATSVPAPDHSSPSGSSQFAGRDFLANYRVQPLAHLNSPNSATSSTPLQFGMAYSSLLKGGLAIAVAVDSQNAMYIVGQAFPNDLPVSPGAYQPANHDSQGMGEIFIQKLNPAGDQIVYATYLGGSSGDVVYDVKVDAGGNAYLVGYTPSSDFPVTTGAAYHQNSQDVFVTKLNSTGTALVYSTLVGGSGNEQGASLELGPLGDVFVSGQTSSTDFPTTSGAYDTSYNGGNYDGFIFRLNSSGSGMVYSSYFGGSGSDCEISGNYRECTLAVDPLGAVYVAGRTTSSDFPITPGAYNTLIENGSVAAFAMKFKPDGSGLAYSTFIWGQGINCEITCAIAVDAVGMAYIAGTTDAYHFLNSNSLNASWRDVFLVKFNRNGSALEYALLTGGTNDEIAEDLVIDEYGSAYVVGVTKSNDFSGTSGRGSWNLWSIDGFVLKVDWGGQAVYASYLGGNMDDWALGAALGPDGQLYVTGEADSGDFPVTQNVFPRTVWDNVGFITRYDLRGTSTYTVAKDRSSLCPACNPDETVGDPILTRLGIFSEAFEYLPVATRAGNLTFTPWYSSSSDALSLYSTLMGPGWTHNHDLRLIFPTDPQGETGYVLFKSGTANLYYFIDNGNGTYTADAGVTSKLVKDNTTPVQYIVQDASQNQYIFDANGKVTRRTTAVGASWSYTYDSSNRLDRVTDDASQRFLEFSYNAQNRIQTVSDFTGRSVSLAYNATSGDMTTLVDPLTQTWTFTYDNAHHLRLVTNPANVTVIHTEYDAQGRAYQQYDPQGNLSLSIDYATGGITEITNSAGGVQTHVYGSRNKLNAGLLADDTVSQPLKRYDPNFRPAVITDGNSKNTRLQWDATGANLTRMIDPEKGQTDLTYDTYNNPTSFIDARGYLTTFTYADPAHPTLVTQSVDALSNVTQYEYTTAADAPQPAGLLKRIVAPGNQITSYTYDASGQRLTMTDPQNRTTTYTYDVLGRVRSVRDPLGQTNWSCYDALGRMVRSVSNASGDGSTPQTNPCDAQNYQASADPRFDRVNLTFYDASGNVIGTVDAKGVVSRTFFDAQNRPYRMTRNLVDPQNPNATPAARMQLSAPPAYDPAYPDRNITRETRYDAAGRTIASIAPDGTISRTYYDAYNRPLQTTANLKDPANPNASVDALLALATPPAFDANFPDRNLTTTTRYDAAGNAIAIISPTGNITRTYYDGNNRAVQVTVNLYNPDKPDASLEALLALTTPPAFNPDFSDRNQTTATRYDAAGHAILSIDPSGTVTRTCYDALGRVDRTVINPSGDGGTPQTNPCDSQNYVPSSLPTVDRISDTIFDAGGRAIATVDPLGIISRNYYDAQGRQVAATQNLRDPADPNASFTQLMALSAPPAYDPAHPDWNITTRTVYDATRGLAIATIDARGIITRTYYDALNRSYLEVQNLSGQAPEVETPPAFDPAFPDRNVRTETVYDSDGSSIASIANDGRISRTYSDRLGRAVVSVQNLTGQAVTDANPPAYNPAAPDQNVRTETVYDAAGRVVKSIAPDGKVSYSCYDGAGRVVKSVLNPSVSNPCGTYPRSANPAQDLATQTRYDGAGNRQAEIGPDGQTTTYQYDLLNRLVQQLDALNQVTNYTYDVAGNQLTKTNLYGRVTRYEYDVLGELIAVVENYVAEGDATQEQNVRTEYRYDKRGSRVEIKDALGHTTTFTYDSLARLTGEQDALNHTTTYGYDAAGRRICTTDANGVAVFSLYDDLGRLVLIDYPAPETDVTFSYDASGQRRTMQDGSGTTEWTYDLRGYPIQITQPVTGTVHYTYTPGGQQASLTYPDHKTVQYSYDALQRLVGVLDWLGNTTTYSYDAGGRLADLYRLVTPETSPERYTLKTSYTYTALGQTVGITHTSQNEPLAALDYQYAGDGSRVQSQETLRRPAAGGAPTAFSVKRQDFTAITLAWPRAANVSGYHLYRSTDNGATWTQIADLNPVRTQYTDLGRLMAAPAWYRLSAWDGAGEMPPSQVLAETHLGANAEPELDLARISYSYDPLGRLVAADYADGRYFHYTYDAVGNRLSETTPQGTTEYTYDAANRLATVNGVAYTWDNNGNLLSDGVNTYTYDAANRLKSLAGGGVTITYAYNGLGDRISQSANGVTIHYTLDLSGGLTQVLADGTHTYLYGLGRIAQYAASDPTYFLGDALGSVRQLADAGGAVTLLRHYKPFGEVLASVGSATSIYGFDGEQTDPSGLQYLRARYYAPGVGRFISKDTWGGDDKSPMSYNGWAFVYANPITSVDPSGNYRCEYYNNEPHCTEESFDFGNLRNSLENYDVKFEGDWTSALHKTYVSAILDGVQRIGYKFSRYFGLSADRAFRKVYGRAITFKFIGEKDEEKGAYGWVDGFTVKMEPNIQDASNTNEYFALTRLMVHELGHVFSNRLDYFIKGADWDWARPENLLEHGIYAREDGMYIVGRERAACIGADTGEIITFITGKRTQNGVYSRQGGTGRMVDNKWVWTDTDNPENRYYRGSTYYDWDPVIGKSYSTGYQWHPGSMDESGNSASEDWADIFQNWVFNSFAPTKAGLAINSWVEDYMPIWVRIAAYGPYATRGETNWK